MNERLNTLINIAGIVFFCLVMYYVTYMQPHKEITPAQYSNLQKIPPECSSPFWLNDGIITNAEYDQILVNYEARSLNMDIKN